MNREDLEWALLQVELADIEAMGNNGEMCDAFLNSGYHCTRMPGHPGIHAAAGSEGFVVKRWPGEDTR